jgi:UDP-2-acetamido-2-deoxy-ribo-hexuluronate aminotransferase
MNDIRMVDLNGQYLKIKEEIDQEIFKVIDSTQFINGNIVKEFQKNLETYLDVKHVIPCGNGTDALQVAMMALGLQPGDEVITTSFTFIATAEVIALLGLTPVLVDVESNTFLIDPESVNGAITSKTKAIVPVHLFGQAANMEKLLKIAEENNLFIIEDNAQAIGADYYFKDQQVKKLGTIGDIGCTSFFPSKNLGCFGDGGAVFTNNDDYAEKLRSIVNHGMRVRYYHDNVGVNSRLDSIQAAILNVKLKHLDNYNENRIKAANYYDKAFENHPNLIIPERVNYSNHIFHQYTLQTKGIDRDKLREELAKEGVPAMVYYPVPLHLQKAYKNERYNDGDFPVTEALSKSVISLPMHTELSIEQQDYIIEKVVQKIDALK